MSHTVHSLIEARAYQRPERVYAVAVAATTEHPADPSQAAPHEIRFGELAHSCRRVGALLRTHGLTVGDTVSVVMPNGLQTLRVLLGTMHAGMIVNPVNLLSSTDQLRYVLAHSDCKLVCVAPQWEAKIRELLATIERPITMLVASVDGTRLPGEAEDDASTPFAAPTPDSVALLMYTSGTTGVPKGVMLRHSNLAANAEAISHEHGLNHDDRVLAVLPLYHINAFAVTMLAPLAHGGSIAMPAKFSAARFWTQAIEAHCTWLNVVPTMVSYLIDASAETGSLPTPEQSARIRFCRSASAALPVEHHRVFEQRFGIGIVETMGLTETAAPSFSNPLDRTARKIGSVGRASGCEARVVDASLHPVADGTAGELAIRGPNVMLGYFRDEAATREAFTPDGWLRTGDLGHRDRDGFYFVTGRIKELIIKGGENIAPREIDEVLLAHPAVLDAAAVGIPDPHYGQEIMACVVLREGVICSEADLRAFSVERLGRFKTPKVLRFVDELPRGPSGKVQRLKLPSLYLET